MAKQTLCNHVGARGEYDSMKTLLTFLSLCVMLLCAYPVQAAQNVQNEHASVSLHVSENAHQATKPFWAAVQFKLQKDWHIYWKNPGDSGLAPSFNWTLPEGYEAGPAHFPTPGRFSLSDVHSFGYADEATLLIPITPGDVATGEALSVQVDYLICADVCIPESAALSVNLKGGANPALIEKAQAALPVPYEGNALWSLDGDMVILTFDQASENVSYAQWWPQDDRVIQNGDVQQFSLDENGLTIQAPAGKGDHSGDFTGIVQMRSADGAEVAYHVVAEQRYAVVAEVQEAMPEAQAEADISILSAIVLAFVGGLILNIMPCVLPVLSLKALSLAKKADSKAAVVRREGYAYTAGILVSFGVLAAIVIGFQEAGQAVGWGFQLQSPVFVSILIYVLFLVGLNLSGVFEISGRFMNAGSGAAAKQGPSGAFFTGVLAAIVATPCTAPFMATALGFAFTQPPIVSMLIFLALGFGLAFPLLLISLVPAARHLLPKPGTWMVRFKQFLAFPIYASVIWLVWVLVQQSGPEGLLLTLGGLLILAFAAWILSFGNGLLKLIVIVLSIYGLYHTLIAQKVMPFEAHKADYQQPFSPELLAQYRSENKPVFVVGTAAWCITCKVNERGALADASVKQHVQDNAIQYLVADWTNRNESFRVYLESLGRNGVPLYAWYAPGEEAELLPQILTPAIIKKTLQ